MPIQQAADALCPNENKRRWTENEEDGCSSTLKRRLYALLKNGVCTDLELLVTTDNEGILKLRAHKNILVAMSSVISKKMTRLWEEGGQGKYVIEIPSDVGLQAVEMFLKFLYTEELKQDLAVELWLELLFLADYYEVEDLMTLCDGKLIDKLNVENCIKIYEKSRLFQGVNCWSDSFNLLKKNFAKILTSVSSHWIQMDASTWEEILNSDYLPNVDEIELFKSLKRWKDENAEERVSYFQDLIKLIRFPFVGIGNFAEFVAPSRELDSELMLQMFIYFAGKGPVPEQFMNCRPRNCYPILIPENKINLIIEERRGKIGRPRQSRDKIEFTNSG